MKLNKGLKRNKRRCFLLLEVVIAFALVVLCALPLVYPHVFISQAQKQFISKLDLDHAVNLLYADVLLRIYTDEILWNQMLSEDNQIPLYPIDETMLRRAGIEKPLPFKGSYFFREVKHKPSKDQGSLKAYLIQVEFLFYPGTINREGVSITPNAKPFSYPYTFCAFRSQPSTQKQKK